jgi:hypothetical protein
LVLVQAKYSLDIAVDDEQSGKDLLPVPDGAHTRDEVPR